MSFFLTTTAASFRVQGEEVPVSPYEQETMDFMNATATPDDSVPSIYTGLTNHDCWELLDSVIKYWKSEGVWADIYHWHPMFGDAATKLRYNAKDISKFQASFYGSWVFNASGCKGNGVNTYARFGFIPANEMIFENSGLSIVVLSNDEAPSVLELGSSSGTNNRTYIQSKTSNNSYIRIGSTLSGVFANTNAIGIYSGTRYNGVVKAYKNLVEKSSGSGGGSGLSNQDSAYGAYNLEGAIELSSTRKLGSMMHHKSTDIVKVHTGLQMWEEGLGRLTI